MDSKFYRETAAEVKMKITLEGLHGLACRGGMIELGQLGLPDDVVYGWRNDSEAIIAQVIEAATVQEIASAQKETDKANRLAEFWEVRARLDRFLLWSVVVIAVVLGLLLVFMR